MKQIEKQFQKKKRKWRMRRSVDVKKSNLSTKQKFQFQNHQKQNLPNVT